MVRNSVWPLLSVEKCNGQVNLSQAVDSNFEVKVVYQVCILFLRTKKYWLTPSLLFTYVQARAMWPLSPFCISFEQAPYQSFQLKTNRCSKLRMGITMIDADDWSSRQALCLRSWSDGAVSDSYMCLQNLGYPRYTHFCAIKLARRSEAISLL